MAFIVAALPYMMIWVINTMACRSSNIQLGAYPPIGEQRKLEIKLNVYGFGEYKLSGAHKLQAREA
jgi:hypothetical protein